ncbi:MAG: 6,7-dimethyl-8-ribityllumazine synthase [Planctomycetota bacterium]
MPIGKIAIIASRYHSDICDPMVDAAIERICAAGYDRSTISIIRVPGAWEIPPVTQMMIDHTEFIAAIVFGCVIRGETSHDQHINREVSRAIMEMTIASGKPIGFGLLTVNDRDQALARAGGNVGNKGEEAADAVIELLRLYARMSD